MTRVCAFACTILFFACQPPTPDTETPEATDAGVEPTSLDAGMIDAGVPTLEGALNLWLTGADSMAPLAAGQSRELFIEVSGLLRSSQSSARFALEAQVDPGFGQVSPLADVTFSDLDGPGRTLHPVSTTLAVRLTPSGGAPTGTLRVNIRPTQTGCELRGVCLSLEFPVAVGQGLDARALGGLAPLMVTREQVARPQGVSLLVPVRNGSAPRTWVVSGVAPTDWAVDGEQLVMSPGATTSAFLKVRWTGAGSPTANVTHSIRVEARSGSETESATALLTVTP